MSDFLGCTAIEEGGFTFFVMAVILLLFLSLAALCYVVFRAALKNRNAKVELHIDDKVLKMTGATTALVALFVGVFFLALPPGGVWYLHHIFGDYYSISIDAGGVNTLESIRATLSHEKRTHVTVVIPDDLKNFRIKGDFTGACVADIVDALCRTYPRDLRCTCAYIERTVKIEHH